VGTHGGVLLGLVGLLLGAVGAIELVAQGRVRRRAALLVHVVLAQLLLHRVLVLLVDHLLAMNCWVCEGTATAGRATGAGFGGGAAAAALAGCGGVCAATDNGAVTARRRSKNL
jgi:hypothetical protein